MPKSKSGKKKPPKRVLALPDLEHAKTAVLNSLTSASGQQTYDHAIREFVAWLSTFTRDERRSDWLLGNCNLVAPLRLHVTYSVARAEPAVRRNPCKSKR